MKRDEAVALFKGMGEHFKVELIEACAGAGLTPARKSQSVFGQLDFEMLTHAFERATGPVSYYDDSTAKSRSVRMTSPRLKRKEDGFHHQPQ